MSAVHLAPVTVEPVVLQLDRNTRTVLPIVRNGVEYVRHERTLSGLQPPMAVDDMPSMRPVIAPRRLVRTRRRRSLERRERRP